MLRKRARSVQKDQQMGQITVSDSGCEFNLQSDVGVAADNNNINTNNNHRKNSFFSLPGVFVGLSQKGLSDSDSARSPTSPLDYRVFSNLANCIRSPRSQNGNKKIWNGDKVGLSIVDSLDDVKKPSALIIHSSDSKNVLLKSQMSLKAPKSGTHFGSFDAPKSLPKSHASPHNHVKSPLNKGSSNVVFEIGDAASDHSVFGKSRSSSLDSCSFKKNSPSDCVCWSLKSSYLSHANSNSTSLTCAPSNEIVGSLSAEDVESSEDYTCVILHGPNPKTTHIFCDHVLECQPNNSSSSVKNDENNDMMPLMNKNLVSPALYSSNDYLSFCHTCKKTLDESKDIYIYRGEKAFCSLECRSEEIKIDDELEKYLNSSPENSSESAQEPDLSGTGFEA